MDFKSDPHLHTSHLRSPAADPWTIDIVIATRNRAEALRDCLASIDSQTLLPSRTLIIDSSPNTNTQELVSGWASTLTYCCSYHHTSVASAARQRNIGAKLCTSQLILLLDDDVVLEPTFI